MAMQFTNGLVPTDIEDNGFSPVRSLYEAIEQQTRWDTIKPTLATKERGTHSSSHLCTELSEITLPTYLIKEEDTPRPRNENGENDENRPKEEGTPLNEKRNETNEDYPKEKNMPLGEKKNETDKFCPKLNMKRWEESGRIFYEHERTCENCKDWFQYDCPTHGKHSKYRGNVISVSRSNGNYYCFKTEMGHLRNCLCTNVDTTYPAHSEIPWMVCYDLNCDYHKAEKERNGYMPEEPKIVEKARHWCPYRILDCTCISYPGHEKHKSLNWTTCYDENCQTHYSSKMDNSWIPQPRGMVKHENLTIKENRVRESKRNEAIEHLRGTDGSHLFVMTKIMGQDARILIDTGATANYVDRRFAKRANIEMKKLPQARLLRGLVGEAGKLEEMINANIKIGDCETNFEAYVTEFPSYDAVLGLPWIRKHNPVIDWQTGVLYFHMNKEHLQATYDDKLKLPEELKEYKDVFQPTRMY
jgi:gag-polyprotein putative aspartyl protease